MQFADEWVAFKPLTSLERLACSASFMGIATAEYILNFYRKWMNAQGICPSCELACARQSVGGSGGRDGDAPGAADSEGLPQHHARGLSWHDEHYRQPESLLAQQGDDGVVNVLCDKPSSV